jgi:polyisoprenoid-binding protein YceI
MRKATQETKPTLVTGPATGRPWRSTYPIVLRAELRGSDTHPSASERIALQAAGKLGRSDWGMTYGPILISERAKLQLDVSAVRQG